MAWPTSPVTGDTWEEFGRTWVFDGVGWTTVPTVVVSGRTLPAFLADGTLSPIPLNADGTVPAWLADGTYAPIPTQA